MGKNPIDVHKEEATHAGPTKVRLKTSGREPSAKAVVVATGARPRSLPVGIAQRLEATWEEFEARVHSHPTLSEAVKEAALALKGAAAHT